MRTLAVLLAMMAAGPAWAADSCPTDDDRAVLRRFTERLASAGTAEEARDRALSKIELGQRAIHKAERLLPGEAVGIAEASARLDALEAGVRSAETQAAVAAQFDQLGANAVRCDYDTVEIVVIVIGFVLGIIPGIIFLFLFC